MMNAVLIVYIVYSANGVGGGAAIDHIPMRDMAACQTALAGLRVVDNANRLTGVCVDTWPERPAR